METSVKITLIIVAAILLVGAAGGFLYWKANIHETATTINVNGDATIKATPDVISVYFNVQTNGTTAQEAKDANADVVDKVITNLIKIGLERKDITTSDFNVYPDYTWEDNKQKFLGYKATHSIKVQLNANNTDKVGSVIDGGIDGGALINYINFELSPDLENQYKAAALKKASEDARTKADSVASGLGKSVVGIQSVSESNFNYYPWRLYDNVAMASGGAEAKVATTNIQPGEKDVTAQVNVVFKIK